MSGISQDADGLSLIRRVEAPFLNSLLEQRVDERRERGAFRHHDDEAEEYQHEHDGGQPELLADAQEAPELAEDTELRHNREEKIAGSVR